MAATADCLVSTSAGNARSTFVSESDPKFGENVPRNLRMSYGGRLSVSRRPLTIRAGRNDGRSSSAGIFVGFVLGGIIVGALGCVYAPQISKALAGANRRRLMSRLPKFIYDEEKALEGEKTCRQRTRKELSKKIEQVNSEIDEVSAQLRADDPPN